MEKDTFKEELLEIAIDTISVNPYQPRRSFSLEDLEELSLSIKNVGIIHPPTVRRHHEGYQLISGERRFRAAQLAGLRKIPVIVKSMEETTSAEAALIENLQRVDLNPMEIAYSFQKLMQKFQLNQSELAQRIGKNRSSVANYLRLLTLPPFIQESVSKQEITMGHAKALLSISCKEAQQKLHLMVIGKSLSVRETERLAQSFSKSNTEHNSEKKKKRDCHLENLKTALEHHFGTTVNIEAQGQKGKISIQYYNYDDLDRILEVLGVVIG